MGSRRHPDFTTPHPGEPGHVYETPCFINAKWCRIHQYPDWTSGVLDHMRYPGTFYVPTGETYVKGDGTEGLKWREVVVHCGPMAFYPNRKTAGIK
jgi:hypothetical protein